MRFDSGTIDIPSAGTRVQISNTNDRVLSIEIHARAGNTGVIYFGRDDVSSTNGREIAKGATVELDFTFAANLHGSERFSSFYVDAATNGDDADFMVILA